MQQIKTWYHNHYGSKARPKNSVFPPATSFVLPKTTNKKQKAKTAKWLHPHQIYSTLYYDTKIKPVFETRRDPEISAKKQLGLSMTIAQELYAKETKEVIAAVKLERTTRWEKDNAKYQSLRNPSQTPEDYQKYVTLTDTIDVISNLSLMLIARSTKWTTGSTKRYNFGPRKQGYRSWSSRVDLNLGRRMPNTLLCSTYYTSSYRLVLMGAQNLLAVIIHRARKQYHIAIFKNSRRIYPKSWAQRISNSSSRSFVSRLHLVILLSLISSNGSSRSHSIACSVH